ncbi:LPXTG cell wall anchor domain-containing protein [Priestia megaterium]|nr:LPXTG cell wall anchor domain-containing protein [Priestia megaterium]
MNEYLWPWQAKVMMQHPWIMLISFIILSIPLSIISWKRKKN